LPTEIYFNVAISGLLTGLIYGLSALGLSVIFGVIRIVNFAHGEIMVCGMFVTLILFRRLGIDPLVAVPLVAVVLFGFGYLLQDLVVRRVAHLADHMQFLLMAAIAVMLIALCLMLFGPDAQGVNVR
jgi:branched-chain amino acid transport system permease protein